MITQEKPQPQVSAPQTWDKPTSAAQIGDYIRVPFAPMMQVVERDVLEGGQVWLLLKPITGSYTEEWLLEPEAEQQLPAPQTEPSGFSGDSVACQLRVPIGGKATPKLEVAPQQLEPTPETAPEPTPSVESEFDTGRTHGKHDVSQGWHPIYSQPTTDYARGYLSGYRAGVNATDEQPKVSLPVEWSLTWNQRWGWYDVWVGHRWIGRAATEESAERMATKRIATDETIKRQNAAVMASYAA